MVEGEEEMERDKERRTTDTDTATGRLVYGLVEVSIGEEIGQRHTTTAKAALTLRWRLSCADLCLAGRLSRMTGSVVTLTQAAGAEGLRLYWHARTTRPRLSPGPEPRPGPGPGPGPRPWRWLLPVEADQTGWDALREFQSRALGRVLLM